MLAPDANAATVAAKRYPAKDSEVVSSSFHSPVLELLFLMGGLDTGYDIIAVEGQQAATFTGKVET